MKRLEFKWEDLEKNSGLWDTDKSLQKEEIINEKEKELKKEREVQEEYINVGEKNKDLSSPSVFLNLKEEKEEENEDISFSSLNLGEGFAFNMEESDDIIIKNFILQSENSDTSDDILESLISLFELESKSNSYNFCDEELSAIKSLGSQIFDKMKEVPNLKDQALKVENAIDTKMEKGKDEITLGSDEIREGLKSRGNIFYYAGLTVVGGVCYFLE